MTAVADSRSLTYLARRGVPAQWRGFLRALVETLDANLDTASRDALLRAVGARLAGLMALPPCSSLLELEARMNEALAGCDWGWVEVALDPHDRSLLMTHSLAPSVPAGVEPSDAWISAVLEGLYGTWLGSQPGSDPSLTARRIGATAATVTFRFGHG